MSKIQSPYKALFGDEVLPFGSIVWISGDPENGKTRLLTAIKYMIIRAQFDIFEVDAQKPGPSRRFQFNKAVEFAALGEKSAVLIDSFPPCLMSRESAYYNAFFSAVRRYGAVTFITSQIMASFSDVVDHVDVELHIDSAGMIRLVYNRLTNARGAAVSLKEFELRASELVEATL
jgi:archaellum biogenesis ATPase FlaH